MTFIDIGKLTVDGENVDFSNAFIEVSERNGFKSWRIDITSTNLVLPFDKEFLEIHATDTSGKRYSGEVIVKKQSLETSGNNIELLGTGPLHGYTE